MTTLEAFFNLCLDTKRCEKIGMKDNTRRAYLSYLKNNRYISTNKMEELLIRAGYGLKNKSNWSFYLNQSYSDMEELQLLLKNIHPVKYKILENTLKETDEENIYTIKISARKIKHLK